jgi:nucleoside 2-deoxyribosyltransferase
MAAERIVAFGRNIDVVVPSEKLIPGIRLYMAGPDGFAQSTQEFHAKMCDFVAEMGGEPLDPWELTPDLQNRVIAVSNMPLGPKKEQAWKELNAILGQNNRNSIERSTGVVANLDGVDVDSGTASEIGFAYGHAEASGIKRPIIGYRGDFRLSADNIGSTVNLQVGYFIRASGGTIITDIKDLPKALLAFFGENVA